MTDQDNRSNEALVWDLVRIADGAIAIDGRSLEGAMNAVLARMRFWQPIGEAPRDGTKILLGEVHNQFTCQMIVGWWDVDSGWCAPDCWSMKWPTHWMHLPEPPHPVEP